MSLLSHALTTVARFASYAGITTPTGSKLTLAEDLINAVTGFVEDYLGFRVQKTVYAEEEYPTEEGQVLLLKNYPIISGESFVLARRTSALNEDRWETVNAEYYHVDDESGIIHAAGGWEFSRTRNGFRASYTAGFDYDNSATFLSDTKGASIELAAWMLMESLWGRRKGGIGIISESIGDYKVVYSKLLMENDEIKSLLDKHVREDTFGVITPLQI